MKDREKQIAEIADHIKGTGLSLPQCESEVLADVLYMLGYRKERRARWKWGYSEIGHYGIWCTDCGSGWVESEQCELIAYSHDYCPKCGAKMDKKP